VAAWSLGLGRLASWAEARFDAYPYQAGEDPLRWLLPTVFGRDGPTILVVGGSAVREGMLYEVMSRAVGGRVLNGGLSNGTLDEISLGLEYIARVYGEDALPDHIVFGMTKRVLGNFPRSFGPNEDPDAYPPLTRQLDRYSRLYGIQAGELGSSLTQKSVPQALLARFRWWTKQQPRHRTALAAGAEHLMDPEVVKVGFQDSLPLFDHIRRPLSKADWGTTWSWVRSRGIGGAAGFWLPAYRSSYYRIFMPPLTAQKTAAAIDRWGPIFAWDPLEEEPMVRYQLRRFEGLLAEHGIGLTLVYVPEHPDSRARYPEGPLDSYRRLIAEEWPDATVIDLWDRLPAEQFYDNIHPTYAGAHIITRAVLESFDASGPGGE
jgi:hypothetical protein